METYLLLLSLELILAGSSGSKMERIKEECSEEEMTYDMVKSNQEKQTTEVLMNLILLCKNTSLIVSKDVISSSSLTFKRLHFCFPKRKSTGNNKEYCNDMVVERKISEAFNASCKFSSNFILGSMEVIHGTPKAPSCKCGQNLGISYSESSELETTMHQLTMGKQFPRCQRHSVTSLKKILTVLTGHSLMSWLVSGSQL